MIMNKEDLIFLIKVLFWYIFYPFYFLIVFCLIFWSSLKITWFLGKAPITNVKIIKKEEEKRK